MPDVPSADPAPPWFNEAFDGPVLDDRRWVGGYCNEVDEALLSVDRGLHVRLIRGSRYVSAAVLTRVPVRGDFVATVGFSTGHPGPGTTLEIAAITLDGPRDTQLDQNLATAYDRSLVFDVHGAPPYVSSEFDEADGARIGWNRGPALTTVRQEVTAAGTATLGISDNRYNRYGPSSWPEQPVRGPVTGWLALARQGEDWATWYRCRDEPQWRLSGVVRAMNLAGPVFIRLGAKHWPKSGRTAPGTAVRFHGFALAPALPGCVPPIDAPSSDAPSSFAGRATAPGRPSAAGTDTGTATAGTTATATATATTGVWPGRGVPPPEVAITQQVRACQACSWSSEELRFGAFLHVRPVEAADGADTADGADGTAAAAPGSAGPTDESPPVIRVQVESLERPQPDALYGCRKAPLMLVGINPNLGQGWLAPPARDSALSARPADDDTPGERATESTGSWLLRRATREDAAYARHHRHAPSHRLWATRVEDLEALLADGRSPVVAAAASVLAPAPPREGKPDPRGHTWRSVDRRWIRLTLWPSPAEPSSPAAAAVQIAERSWPADAQWLVLRQRAQAGQTVAGMADAASAVGRQLDARAGPVDRYYAQADQVLQALGRHLAPAGSRLRLGEDLSLHDALACASPAWSNWKIPAEATQQACVQHHGWLHRQIAHSRPRVLLVTSSTALRLMASDRHGRFSPPLPLPGASVWSEIGGADDLRRWVADHGLTWTPQGQAPIPVVLAGHLSYADSLAPQCHVPVRQWDAFCALFPDAVQVLVNAGLVDGRTIAAGSAGAPAPAAPAAPAAARPQVIRLSARGADRHAPVWQALAGCRRSGTLPPDLATVLLPGASAADALEPWWHDPQQELIARLLTAVRAQKVAWDPQRQALAREVGDCRYCDNDWWQIDGGCRYAGAVPPGPPSPSNPPDLPSPPDPLTAQQETRP